MPRTSPEKNNRTYCADPGEWRRRQWNFWDEKPREPSWEPVNALALSRSPRSASWARAAAKRPEPVRLRKNEVLRVDYTDRLRRLALNDARFTDTSPGHRLLEPEALDLKSLALVRLAALIAVGGAVPSFGAQVDAAVTAGASATEIVDVLLGVAPVLGLPCVVAAAPRLALALGYDVEADW
jgi:alkylhydroperoxidase/carboxymuconolactone decarboxylase family protein YurZ